MSLKTDWNKSTHSHGNGGDCVEARLELAPFWKKSSHSGGNGGHCVETRLELASTWEKSTYSGSNGGNCVEVARDSVGAAMRDTQNRDHGHLEFPLTEWNALITGVGATAS